MIEARPLPARYARLVLGIGSAALMLVLAFASTAARAQEIVVNGDFARAGDPPPGWVRDRDSAHKGTIRVVDGTLEMAPNSANTPGSAKPLGLGQAIDA